MLILMSILMLILTLTLMMVLILILMMLRLTGGCWSPIRMSLFFTTRQDGVLEAWDFLYRHKAPVLQCKVADYPLYCLKVQCKVEDYLRLLTLLSGEIAGVAIRN